MYCSALAQLGTSSGEVKVQQVGRNVNVVTK